MHVCVCVGGGGGEYLNQGICCGCSKEPSQFERERESEREKKIIAGQVVTISANVLNKTVLPITINEAFDPTNRSAHLSYQ